jgi:hypothetical protein
LQLLSCPGKEEILLKLEPQLKLSAGVFNKRYPSNVSNRKLLHKPTCQITKQPTNNQSILTTVCQNRASVHYAHSAMNYQMMIFSSIYRTSAIVVFSTRILLQPSPPNKTCNFMTENKFTVEKIT